MQSFFKISTRSARQLGAGADGVVRAETLSHRPVFLVRFAEHPTLGFMVAESTGGHAGPLIIDGVAIKSAIQPWRVRQADGGVTLHDPGYGNVLSVRDNGTIALQSPNGPPEATLLQLEAASEGELTQGTAGILQQLRAVLPKDLNGPDLLDVIATILTQETAEAMQAVLRLATRDQIVWLGATLVGLPAHLARFSAAFPDDIWAGCALPNLRTWLETRKGAAMLEASPELDFLAHTGLMGYPTSAAHVLNIAARANVPPRRPVCVVATARNEGLYLLEWVAYHKLIGADALFLYSNDNSDGSDDLLRALAIAGEITWIENRLEPGHHGQLKSYGHALGVMPGVLDFRWTLVIDLDEFFAFDPTRYRSLPDYIDWQETQHVDAISLNWLVYGSNGTTSWSDTPMVERFTKRLPWIDPHIKSLSRSNLCMQSHPHHAVFPALLPVTTRDSDGELYRWKDGFSFSATPRSERAWISHYFLKSAEEFVWKFSRNRGDQVLVRDLDPKSIDRGFMSMFLKQHQSPTMIEDARTTTCAPGLRLEIERLRGLPGIRAAERLVRSQYAEQIAALLSRLPTSGDDSGDASPLPEFVRLCLRRPSAT